MKQAGPLEPLIEALLAKEPEERPSAEEVERVLRDVVSGAPTQLTPTRPVPAPISASMPGPAPTPAQSPLTATTVARARDAVPPRARGRRRVAVWGALAVVVAAATVAGGWSLTRGDKSGGTHHKAAASASASVPPAVPAGYHLVTEKELGVSFPVPDGWKRGKATAEQVTYVDETRLVDLTIGMVEPAGANPESHFTNIEANTKINYPDSYRKLRMLRTTFQEKPAAVWEFTFKGRVRAFRAIDLGFGQEGGREYDIYLSAPDLKWDTFRPVFDTVSAGFRVG
jgi:hypothetical protein